jgi:hypothetical protein
MIKEFLDSSPRMSFWTIHSLNMVDSMTGLMYTIQIGALMVLFKTVTCMLSCMAALVLLN